MVTLEDPRSQQAAGPHRGLLGVRREKEWRPHYLHPSPASWPRPEMKRVSAFCNFSLVSFIINTAYQALLLSGERRRAPIQNPTLGLWASMGGSPVSPGQVICPRVTQFSNLSNRVTRNPAYLIGWFRPRLAGHSSFVVAPADAREGGGAGLGGAGPGPSEVGDVLSTARRQPPRTSSSTRALTSAR